MGMFFGVRKSIIISEFWYFQIQTPFVTSLTPKCTQNSPKLTCCDIIFSLISILSTLFLPLNTLASKLTILESLKRDGGPFTNSGEIDTFLAGEGDEKVKLKRMKEEVMYARDTCTSLPRSCHFFKFFTSDSSKKRTQLTPDEFGETLKALLGKIEERLCITMGDFRLALWHYK